MNYQGIIFDFDGTIADTLPLCFYSFQEVFKNYDNRILSFEEILNMFGPSEVGIIQQNLKASDQIESAIEDYYTTDVLFVGDSNADIESGNRAGIKTVAASWFPGSHKNFTQTPSYFCDDIRDFKKLINYVTEIV